MAAPSKYAERWPTRWPEKRVPAVPSPPASPWRSRAACAGQDVDAFTDVASQAAGAALGDRWCARCPVVAECGRYGVQTRAWGMWGGVVLVDGKPAPVQIRSESIAG